MTACSLGTAGKKQVVKLSGCVGGCVLHAIIAAVCCASATIKALEHSTLPDKGRYQQDIPQRRPTCRVAHPGGLLQGSSPAAYGLRLLLLGCCLQGLEGLHLLLLLLCPVWALHTCTLRAPPTAAAARL
jgi:hypothetical protein